MAIHIRVDKKLGDFSVEFEFTTNGAGITALFGHSGAGKTSVVNMVSGLLKPDAGRIAINDTVVFDSEKKINLAPEKRRCGYVFQDGRLFPHMNVESNLLYGMRLVPEKERLINFGEVIELLGIEHLLNRRPAKLSGGEKQRVAMGRALLTSPHILLLDEPLASLDEPRKAEVLPFIAKLPKALSIPILYVSHSLNEIRALANKIVIMEKGRIVDSGEFEFVFKRYAEWKCLDLGPKRPKIGPDHCQDLNIMDNSMTK
jgi:molybdate transport system ATP-binding protein